MPVSLEQLTTDALSLSPEERIQLAERLWESVDPSDDVPLSEAWMTEIQRRRQEIMDGTVETIPAEEFFAEMRRRFGA